MGRNNYFQFKQFRINQKRSAMKVGIDGILLEHGPIFAIAVRFLILVPELV